MAMLQPTKEEEQAVSLNFGVWGSKVFIFQRCFAEGLGIEGFGCTLPTI